MEGELILIVYKDSNELKGREEEVLFIYILLREKTVAGERVQCRAGWSVFIFS